MNKSRYVNCTEIFPARTSSDFEATAIVIRVGSTPSEWVNLDGELVILILILCFLIFIMWSDYCLTKAVEHRAAMIMRAYLKHDKSEAKLREAVSKVALVDLDQHYFYLLTFRNPLTLYSEES